MQKSKRHVGCCISETYIAIAKVEKVSIFGTLFSQNLF